LASGNKVEKKRRGKNETKFQRGSQAFGSNCHESDTSPKTYKTYHIDNVPVSEVNRDVARQMDRRSISTPPTAPRAQTGE
jgi:hypothetical protein